jgi:hypothetical protein
MPKIIGRISFMPTPDDPFGDLEIDDVEEPPEYLNLTVDQAAAEGLKFSVQQVYDTSWPTEPAPEAA